MTYDAYETSRYGGLPVELHTIQAVTGGKIWRITSAARDKVHPSTGYTFDYVAGLERGEMIASTSGKKKELSIVIPLDHEIAQFFFTGVPSAEVRWTIERYHADDPDQEVITYWDGYIYEPDFDLESSECKFIGRPDPRQAETVLDKTYGQQCQYNPYDKNCGLAEGDLRVSVAVGAISSDGLTIDVSDISAYADDYFKGGGARLTKDDVIRNIMITTNDQSSQQIMLYQQMNNLAVGDAMILLPSCRKQPSLCDSIFNNKANALWHDMPTKNVYTNSQGLKGV